jgi:translocation and assembly module TamB
LSETKPPSQLRRRLLYASAGVIVLTAGAIAWTLGPGGPWLVSQFAEGRAVWRLGSLHLEGVKGSALGDLRVAHATLRDEDGVWAEATELAVGWEPLRILTREASVRQVSAKTLRIFRQPKLTPAKPPGGSIDVDLNALAIDRISVDEPVFGEAASFSLGAGIAARGARIDRAMVDLKRLDAASDTLRLDLVRKGEVRLDALLEGPKDGFFAAALKSMEPLRIVAHADGDETTGAGEIDAQIGGKPFITGDFAWTPEGWRGGGDANLNLAPAFADIDARIGGAVRLDGSGARGARTTFAITAKTQDAIVNAGGTLGDDWRPAGETRIVADASRLDRLANDLMSGAARFEGVLTADKDVQAFTGRLTGTGVRVAGVRANVDGPARLRFTRDLIDVETDLALAEARGEAEMVSRLARDGKLVLRARYGRQNSRITVREARLQSSAIDVSGDGELGEGAHGLRGVWRTSRLDVFDPAIGGEASGAWTAQGGGAQPVVITADAKTRRFRTTIQPLDQMLGTSPSLNATLAIRGGVIDVRRINISAPKLRAAAFGRLNDGRATMSFEASATGPVRVGAAEFNGTADATGAITGRLDNPTLSATAHLSRLDVGGMAIEQPVVTLNFAPSGAGRTGAIDVKGTVSGQPATATADLASDANGLRLDNLDVRAAGLVAQGNARFADEGPTVDLTFNGPIDAIASPMKGRIRGTATLRPAPSGEAVLATTMRITSGRIGELAFSRLDASASGPLDDIAVRGNLRGSASGAPVNLELAGAVQRAGDATNIRAEASGNINGTTVSTREPFTLSLSPNATRGTGVFALGDGILRATLNDERSRPTFTAAMENAPIGPVTDLLGERASGRATGTIRLSGGDTSLEGDLDLVVTDALLARRTRDPLSMQVKGRISGGAMTFSGTATSRNGLDAAFDARAPVDARARPIRIALAGEGRATWRAKGPAEALWGLVGALDQNVTGNVEGAGDIRFAVGRLSGEGGFTLTGGAFSDKQTGVELRDVSARVRFDDAGARLEQFVARDLRDGTLTGTGEARGLKDGQVSIVASNVRLLNRPDAKAVASGPMALKWTADGMTLSGDLNVTEATLSTPRTDAGIPQLDVIEINRPGEEDETTPQSSEAGVVRANLDVRVRAPGRVFVRDRGLDSEWSVDLRVTGTSTNPRVFGEARLVRGRFTLAGRVFDAESGLIRFNGSPDEALINLAAEMSSPEITARIVLSGPVNDPAIELSSDPALPQDEILPQALFGRASEDLSALEAAQLAASLAQLAGRASLDIAGAARDLVGLDRLDVRETGSGLRVAGGKYLTRDVYLEVARTGVGETETQVEWRLRPQLFLISAFNPQGDRRLSVRWRREY